MQGRERHQKCKAVWGAGDLGVGMDRYLQRFSRQTSWSESVPGHGAEL